MLSLSGVSASVAENYYSADDYYFADSGIGQVVAGQEVVEQRFGEGKAFLSQEEFRQLVNARLLERASEKLEREMQKISSEISATQAELKEEGLAPERESELKAHLNELIEKQRELSVEFEKLALYRSDPSNAVKPETLKALEKESRAADDLTFSAPKSVSLIAALGTAEQREKIIEAHREAVQAVVSFILENNMVQVRNADGKLEPAEGVVALRFDHMLSRSQDPQLHSHVLLVNQARREDGKTVSLQLHEVYANKLALGTLYRHELASRLEALGYQVEWNKAGLFEVKGFTQEQLREFSRRRQQIEKALQEKGLEGGKAAEIAAKDTREAKKAVNPVALRARWEEQARAAGIQIPVPQPRVQKQEVSQEERVEQVLDTQERAMLAEQTIEKAVNTAGFSNDLRATLAMALSFAREGKTATIEELKDWVDKARESMAEKFGGERDLYIDRLGREWFSFNNNVWAELRAVEEKGIRDGQFGLDLKKAEKSFDRFNAKLEKEKGFRLDDHQRQIALSIATSQTDSVLEGKAGAGKTTLMQAIVSIHQDQGREVIGLAPTGTAAKNLQNEAGIKSYTVDALAFMSERLEKQVDRLRGGLIIVDEAGMLSSKQAATVLEVADRLQMKVLWVGDRSQIKPVQAGDPFEHLTSQAVEKGTYHALEEIYRQKPLDYREAVVKASVGDVEKSLEILKDKGWVKEISAKGELVKQVVQDYLEKAQQGEQMLVVTERKEMADRLNKEIRYHMQQAGFVSKEETLIKVKDTDGKSLGEKAFAVGDRVMFLRNDRKLNVTNGMAGEVVMVNELTKTMVVRVGDQREVKFNWEKYNYLSHSYSITVHKSQGMTVQHVTYVSDTRRANVTNLNLFYVAISRGRETCQIYTTSLEKFEKQIQEGAEKKSVVDILASQMVEPWQRDEHSREELRHMFYQSERNEVGYQAYNAHEDVKTGVALSAAREAWWDLSHGEKKAFVESMLFQRQKEQEARPQTEPRQEEHIGHATGPRSEQPVQEEKAEHVHGPRETEKRLGTDAFMSYHSSLNRTFERSENLWPKQEVKNPFFKAIGDTIRPTWKAYARWGMWRSEYYAALRRGDWTFAKAVGKNALGLKHEHIRKDIGFSKWLRREEKADWKFAMKYGLDVLGKTMAFEAVKNEDLGKAIRSMFFNFEEGQKALEQVLNRKIDNFINAMFEKAILFFGQSAERLDRMGEKVLDKVADALEKARGWKEKDGKIEFAVQMKEEERKALEHRIEDMRERGEVIDFSRVQGPEAEQRAADFLHGIEQKEQSQQEPQQEQQSQQEPQQEQQSQQEPQQEQQSQEGQQQQSQQEQQQQQQQEISL